MKALIASLLLGVCVVSVATAQTQRTGDNNARAMQQLQQLTAERAQLKADNDKLKQELDDVKKQLASSNAERSALQQKLKTTELAAARDSSTSQQSTEASEKIRTQMQELIGRFRETASTLKEVEGDRNLLRGKLAVNERELSSCFERNAALFEVNTQSLDRLEKRGAWSSLAEMEPFTKIQRTRLENLIAENRARAADLRIETKTK